MRKNLIGVGVLAVVCGLVGWLAARMLTEPAQAQDKRVKVGKFEYVSAGLMTVVAIDTETNKTYALAPPGFVGVDAGAPIDFVWVPIEKFEDVEKYRKWWKQRRDEALKEQNVRGILFQAPELKGKAPDPTTRAPETIKR